MTPVFAHNPEAILSLILGAVVVAWIGSSLLYSLVSGFWFMVLGLGKGVAWWRRLLAPALVAVCVFLLAPVVVLSKPSPGVEAMGWQYVVVSVVVVLILLLPLLLGRFLLRFGWRRSLLAAVLIPLLPAPLILGMSRDALPGEAEQLPAAEEQTAPEEEVTPEEVAPEAEAPEDAPPAEVVQPMEAPEPAADAGA